MKEFAPKDYSKRIKPEVPYSYDEEMAFSPLIPVNGVSIDIEEDVTQETSTTEDKTTENEMTEDKMTTAERSTSKEKKIQSGYNEEEIQAGTGIYWLKNPPSALKKRVDFVFR
ncbi:MAG: hypothetical protein AAF734_04745, partial [Bacteroidota bacterium]